MLVDPSEPVRNADDERTRYKRFVAIAAAVTALFGGVVLLLEARSSVEAGRANRDAQLGAATAMRESVRAYQSWLAAYGVWVDAEGYERRESLAADAFRAGGGLTAATESAQWELTHESLDSQSKLVAPGKYGEAVDPNFPLGYLYDKTSTANLAFVRQEVEQDRASRWGSSSGRFGAAAALLAVSLFLLGLSLTTAAALRPVLLAPTALLVLFCLGITITTVTRDIPDIPKQAIVDVTEGDRLASQRDYDSALARYDAALKRAPDFAQAWTHRSGTRFSLGADAPPGTLFVAWAPPADIDKAARDIDNAIALGADDVASVNLEAALRIHQGRWPEAVAAAEHARDLNPANPLTLANLGSALVAEGRTSEAKATFRLLIDRIRSRPDAIERQALYATTLSVLELIADKAPAHRGLARRLARQLERDAMGRELDGIGQDRGSVSDLSISFGPAGARLDFDAHLPADTRYALVWYRRDRPGRPWSVEPTMNYMGRLPAPFDGAATLAGLPGWCAGSGDYRADVYIAGRFAGSATATRKAQPLDHLGYAFAEPGVVAMCRPLDWTAESIRGARVTLESPNHKQSMTVASYPAPAGSMDNQVLGQVLDVAAGNSKRITDPVAVEFNGLQGVQATYENGDGERVSGRAFSVNGRVMTLLSRGHDADLLAETVQVFST